MSYRPKRLGAFRPTGWVSGKSHSFVFVQAMNSVEEVNSPSESTDRSVPLLKAVAVPARQAHSHCISSGSENLYPLGSLPSHALLSLPQTSIAHSQSAYPVEGWSALALKVSLHLGSGYMAMNWPFVTSHRPSQKSFSILTRRRFSRKNIYRMMSRARQVALGSRRLPRRVAYGSPSGAVARTCLPSSPSGLPAMKTPAGILLKTISPADGKETVSSSPDIVTSGLSPVKLGGVGSSWRTTAVPGGPPRLPADFGGAHGMMSGASWTVEYLPLKATQM